MVQSHSGFKFPINSGTHLDPSLLTSDHSYLAIAAEQGTAGENLVFGEICYLKNDSKFWKADADAVATMPTVVMALESITANASGLFLRIGFVRDDSWSALTVGGLIYADEGTGGTIGAITQTAPAGSGDQVQVLGHAETAVIVWFCPGLELVEIA